MGERMLQIYAFKICCVIDYMKKDWSPKLEAMKCFLRFIMR